MLNNKIREIRSITTYKSNYSNNVKSSKTRIIRDSQLFAIKQMFT